jgi:hypothetical protein
MAPNNLENEDWRPEEYFARVAARRDMTPEQLRARLRRLVDEVNVRGGHLSFERLRDSNSIVTSIRSMRATATTSSCTARTGSSCIDPKMLV